MEGQELGISAHIQNLNTFTQALARIRDIAATGNHQVADQACVASGWLIVYIEDTTSYIPCLTKGNHPGVLLSRSVLTSHS
jgi:hypothetical protein